MTPWPSTDMMISPARISAWEAGPFGCISMMRLVLASSINPNPAVVQGMTNCDRRSQSGDCIYCGGWFNGFNLAFTSRIRCLAYSTLGVLMDTGPLPSSMPLTLKTKTTEPDPYPTLTKCAHLTAI
mgnify:CR=1 FL=1